MTRSPIELFWIAKKRRKREKEKKKKETRGKREKREEREREKLEKKDVPECSFFSYTYVRLVKRNIFILHDSTIFSPIFHPKKE